MSRLLMAAELEFAKVGIKSASVDAIAKRAKVSRQFVYDRLGGKQQLYELVRNTAEAALFGRLVLAGRDQPTPLLAIRTTLEALYANYLARPFLGRIMVDEPMQAAPNTDSPQRFVIHRVMEDYLSQGRACGEIARSWSGASYFSMASSLIAGMVALGARAKNSQQRTIDFLIRTLTTPDHNIEKIDSSNMPVMADGDVTALARILTAAEQTFATSDPDQSSFTSIANLAGVSKQLIFYHFGNKSSLYKAVQDRLLTRIMPHFEAIDLENLESRAVVGRYLETFERVHALYPNSMKLDLDNRFKRGSGEVGDGIGRNRAARFLRRLEAALVRGKDDGVIHRDVNARFLFNVSAILFSSAGAETNLGAHEPNQVSLRESQAQSDVRELIIFGSAARS